MAVEDGKCNIRVRRRKEPEGVLCVLWGQNC